MVQLEIQIMKILVLVKLEEQDGWVKDQKLRGVANESC